MIPKYIYLYTNMHRLVSSAGRRRGRNGMLYLTQIFYYFLRLNGSVNGIKPRIDY